MSPPHEDVRAEVREDSDTFKRLEPKLFAGLNKTPTGPIDQWGETRLSLPFPISTNRLYRSVGRRSILSVEYRLWKAEAAQALMLQRAPRIAGPVEVLVSLVAPNKRAMDGDNRLKSLFDALKTYGVIEDDSNRIVKKFAVEWASIGEPCTIIIKGR